MMSAAFLILGVVAASALATLVSRVAARQSAQFWAAALVIAALIYIGFALRAPLALLLLEAAGVLVYGFVAWIGAARSAWYLAIGWIGHVLWDMFQPASSKAFVPAWYPVSCAGFDTAVAIWLAVTLWRQSRLVEA